jgi:hypothetical protein
MDDQEENQDAPTVHRFGSKRRIGTGDGDGDGRNRPTNFAEGQKQHMDIARREKQKRLELQQRQEARDGGDLDAGVPALAKLGPRGSRAGTAASSSGSRRKTAGHDDGKGLSRANSGLSHGSHGNGNGSSDEGGSSRRSGSGSASGSDSTEFSESTHACLLRMANHLQFVADRGIFCFGPLVCTADMRTPRLLQQLTRIA